MDGESFYTRHRVGRIYKACFMRRSREPKQWLGHLSPMKQASQCRWVPTRFRNGKRHLGLALGWVELVASPFFSFTPPLPPSQDAKPRSQLGLQNIASFFSAQPRLSLEICLSPACLKSVCHSRRCFTSCMRWISIKKNNGGCLEHSKTVKACCCNFICSLLHYADLSVFPSHDKGLLRCHSQWCKKTHEHTASVVLLLTFPCSQWRCDTTQHHIAVSCSPMRLWWREHVFLYLTTLP